MKGVKCCVSGNAARMASRGRWWTRSLRTLVIGAGSKGAEAATLTLPGEGFCKRRMGMVPRDD